MKQLYLVTEGSNNRPVLLLDDARTALFVAEKINDNKSEDANRFVVAVPYLGQMPAVMRGENG